MNWAWANTLDQIWRSPTFPMWLTLAAAGFFGVIGIITLLRAEKSVANGALTVITLLAVGIAATATTRGFGSGNVAAFNDNNPAPPAIPALSCIDDLAGEVVLTACEKVLFGSSESIAAALSYAARQLTRLSELGDLSATNNETTPQLEALRHAVEHDRYGLMAQVLAVRDHCTPSDCAAFNSLSDRRRIVANMEERTYDGLVARYSANWNTPAVPAVAPVTAFMPGAPTGRPTSADFPSAASTPPVSIMTAEPGPTPPRPSAPTASTPTPSPRPTPPPAVAAAKKQPAPKPVRTTAPVSIAPAAPASAAAPAASAPAPSHD